MFGVTCCSSVRRACGLFSTPESVGSMRSLLTPKKRCRRPGDRVGDRRAQQRRRAHLLPGLRVRSSAGAAGWGRTSVRGRCASKRHDLAELQRRVRARRQGQLVQRAGDGEGDIDAARLGFQIDIQDRLDLDRIEER